MELSQAVSSLVYKPGWAFRLETGCSYATGSWPGQTQIATTTGMAAAVLIPGEPARLVITVVTADSGTGKQILIEHRFGVPPWHGGWERWLLDRILDVERHEAMEFFTLGTHRPFFPQHGPGGHLYEITGPASPAH